MEHAATHMDSSNHVCACHPFATRNFYNVKIEVSFCCRLDVAALTGPSSCNVASNPFLWRLEGRSPVQKNKYLDASRTGPANLVTAHDIFCRPRLTKILATGRRASPRSERYAQAEPGAVAQESGFGPNYSLTAISLRYATNRPPSFFLLARGSFHTYIGVSGT
jgi:hypothetical protein